MIFIVTGTPGTGKTMLAKALAKRKDYIYLDLNEFIDSHELKESYDKERETHIVDEERLVKLLIEEIPKESNTIIDSHLSHELPKDYVDKCIITKCELMELKKRLEARGYKKEKVEENLQAEIFDICLHEAIEQGHEPIIIDTTHDSPETLAGKL